MNKLAQIQQAQQLLAAEYLQKQAALEELLKLAVNMAPVKGAVQGAADILSGKNLRAAQEAIKYHVNTATTASPVNQKTMQMLQALRNKELAKVLGGYGALGTGAGLAGYGAYEAMKPEEKSWYEKLLS